MQSKCLEWQRRLRLSEWDIKVAIVSAIEMSDISHQGEISWDFHHKVADIQLLNFEDAEKLGGMRPYNMEETLIHELLHLHFAPLDATEGQHVAEEFAINAIASALYALATPPEPEAAEGLTVSDRSQGYGFIGAMMQ